MTFDGQKYKKSIPRSSTHHVRLQDEDFSMCVTQYMMGPKFQAPSIGDTSPSI